MFCGFCSGGGGGGNFSSRDPNPPQRSNAARVRNMNRFNGGKLPGNSNTFSKGQKIKQFLEREALNVEYL